MSSNSSLQTVFKKAEQQEKNYEWLEAAESYEQALQSKSKTVSPAEIWEKIGFCYNLASRQTENIEEFKKIRQQSSEAYENAAKLYEKEGNMKNQGKVAQCNALAEYVRSWLASDPSEKRKMLDECLSFGKKSLEAYEKVGDQLNFGKTCNDMLFCLFERLYIACDWKEMRDFAQEGIDCADKAIKVFSKLGDKNELLRAYYTASLHGWYAANISEQEEKRKELVQRSLAHSGEALKLSKEVDNPYYVAMANWAAAFCTLLFTEKVESSMEYAQEMLKQGTVVKDNYLKGIASYVLTFVTNWMTLREADPDKKKEGYEKIIKNAQDGIRDLQLVNQDFFIAETYLFFAESYSSLAREVAVTSEERRATLKKAVEIGRRGLDHANRSGSPDAMVSTLHALSKALHFYSNLETGKEEKTMLLEEALLHRQELNKIAERVVPNNDWVRGVGENYEGLIELELAKLETDADKKRTFLESAVLDMEEGVSRCKRFILARPVPTLIVAVGNFEDGFGTVLSELYLLTRDEKILKRATEVYEDAARDFKKVNLPSRVAESYWKMARNQDRLGKHLKAAETFENAFGEYKTAAQRIPHFADFYLDYATYMRAWSEIEKAKSAHEHEEYAIAMQFYDKIASLLKPSKLWGYMSSNFLAWSLLEQAEDMSRKESGKESIDAFEKAAQLFEEAKEAFAKEIEKIQNMDEKEKAVELSKASVRRKDYCLARVNVEEARMYDRKGDYTESAKEYDSAATMLEGIIEVQEVESDRREMRPIASMCRAWQKMKMADARDSPELYDEASELFLKAKEDSTREKTTLLARGNSAFCKALEHGTRFGATREKDDFLKAKQFLESAANYYLKAGFDNASAWTNATEILFDAYNYMTSAELETDLEKKMKAYLLAEKCLERSAGLYENAEYVGKRDEVLRVLDKVKEKREFALSLEELLVAPGDASSTSVISTPRMTVEEPVGLLKFESAFIQANVIAPRREVVAGENLGLDIHFANLGKNTAFLVGVEGIVPAGFDLVEKPEKCFVSDSFLDFRGRKLAPLETTEMKLTLKPKKKGKFVFMPKIQYMDEAGEHKTCELEQVAVTVKELGIRGWLRGPG